MNLKETIGEISESLQNIEETTYFLRIRSEYVKITIFKHMFTMRIVFRVKNSSNFTRQYINRLFDCFVPVINNVSENIIELFDRSDVFSKFASESNTDVEKLIMTYYLKREFFIDDPETLFRELLDIVRNIIIESWNVSNDEN